MSICYLELKEAPHYTTAIADWLHGEWLRTNPHENISTTENDLARLERENLLKQHLGSPPLPTTFLAQDGCRAVGSVSLVYYRLYDTERPSVWLTNMFVLPEYRQQGIASELLSISENFAVIHGVKEVKIFTYDAATFYQKRAWRYLHQKVINGAAVDILEKSFA